MHFVGDRWPISFSDVSITMTWKFTSQAKWALCPNSLSHSNWSMRNVHTYSILGILLNIQYNLSAKILRCLDYCFAILNKNFSSNDCERISMHIDFFAVVTNFHLTWRAFNFRGWHVCWPATRELQIEWRWRVSLGLLTASKQRKNAVSACAALKRLSFCTQFQEVIKILISFKGFLWHWNETKRAYILFAYERIISHAKSKHYYLELIFSFLFSHLMILMRCRRVFPFFTVFVKFLLFSSCDSRSFEIIINNVVIYLNY